MEPSHTLIATPAIGFAWAFVLGVLATRIGLPAIVGYLLAGIAVGPFTPGFVADIQLAPQLSEIGVIFLMFGVGMHFSVRDLVAVWHVAVPGAIGQIVAATALGAAVAHLWDWPLPAGIVFGLALSVASTVVLLRALEAEDAVESPDGRLAVGWLIVEDLVMVVALVLLPTFARYATGDGQLADALPSLGIALAKVAAFAVLMLAVGARAIPWMLARVERLGSRELVLLAGLAVALGVAYGAAEIFGVSFALGAFVAGLVLNGSALGHRVAEQLLPFRDAFAVLFFVAVGMAFDPAIILAEPAALAATIAIVVCGKSLAAFLIVLAMGRPAHTGLRVAAALAQIGEFSFILAAMAVALGILPVEGKSLILGAALASILVNPLAFRLVRTFVPTADNAQ
jgi:CPA2 family monovalent cation:H+ antiporter-2